MSRFLEELAQFIRQQHYTVYSVAEIKDGGKPESVKIIPANDCQDSYSVAKAVVVTAVGLLYDKGLLKVEDKITQILADDCPEEYEKAWDNISLNMLLTHSAGLKGGCLDIDCLDATTFGDDYLHFLMQTPLAYPPGEERLYSDGAFYLLARAVEKITGENLLAYLWHELFFPLDVKEAAWSCCPHGHCMGATGLYIRSEDLAKIGQLYLSGGCYQGRRFLSEDWVNKVLSVSYELHPQKIEGIFAKGGMHCQLLFIDKQKNRVVTYHGYDNVQSEKIMEFERNFEE